jgi:hypothetical protein
MGQTDSLNTQNVTVIGTYTPTVNEGYKLRTLPVLYDSIALRKMPVNYSFYSVPVASTFTPSKGKAAGVERRAPDPLYNSFASLALGNYFSSNADFYSGRDFDRGRKRLDVALHHNSALGQLNSTPLPTDFYRSHLGLTWSQRERDYDWNISGEAQHRSQHWYGLQYRVNEIGFTDSLSVSQHYITGQLHGELTFEDAYLKDASLTAQTISDATNASESRIKAAFNLQFPVSEYFAGLGLFTDLVQGKFDHAPITSITDTGGFSYGYLQAGVRPGVLMQRDKVEVDLGARIIYGSDLENQEGSVYIYPDITAEFAVKENVISAIAGLKGDLRQNTFRDFSFENPFISPTLNIRPSDTKYHAFGGFRGQFNGVLGYSLIADYKNQHNAPIFALNPINIQRDDERDYYLGNSFQVLYQNFKTLGVSAEIQWLVNRNFNLELKGSLYNYETEANQEAYNLPKHEVTLFLEYQMDSGWGLQANVIMMGERTDLVYSAADLIPAMPVVLNGYIDAGFKLSYRINPKWAAFSSVNNLLNTNYQRWAQFPVQGIRVMAGVGYSFDW